MRLLTIIFLFWIGSTNIIAQSIDTAQARLSLDSVQVLRDSSRYKEAIQLAQKTLVDLDGKEVYFSTIAQKLLGDIYYLQKSLDTAQLYYYQVLKTIDIEKTYPRFDISRIHSNLGKVYREKKEYKKAKESIQQSIKSQIAKTGLENYVLSTFYDDLGRINNTLGEYQESLDAFQKGLEIALLTRPENHIHLAGCYNNIGNIYRTLANYSKAKECFEETLRIYKHNYGEEHRSVAMGYSQLAGISVVKGNYEEALNYLLNAINIQENILQPNDWDLGKTYGNTSIVYNNLGEYNKSLEFLKKTEAISLKKFGRDHPVTSIVYTRFGNLFYKMGDYEKSIKNFLIALEIREKVFGINHPDVADTYYDLGILYRYKGQPEESLQYYQKALDIRIKNFGDKHPRIADSYHSFGSLFKDDNQPKKAISYFEKAIAIFKHNFGKDNLEFVPTYMGMGSAYLKLEEFDNAFDYYHRALIIQKKYHAEDHPRIAISYGNLGMVALEEENYETSVDNFKKALEIQLKSLGPDHPETARTYSRLAFVHKKKRDFLLALNFIDKAKKGLNYSGSNFENVQSIAKLINSLNIEGDIYKNYYYSTKDLQYLEAAEKSYLESLEGLIVLKNMNTEMDSKLGILESGFNVFEKIIICNQQLHQNGNTHSLQKSFQYTERSKSLLFRDYLNELNAKQIANLPDSLLNKEKVLIVKINELEEKRFTEETQLKTEEEKDSIKQLYNNKLFTLKRDFRDLKQLYQDRYPEYHKLKFDNSVISIEIFQKHLKDQQSLLEYFVGDSTIFAFLIQKEHYSVHEIAKDFPLDEWVDTLRNSIYDYYLLPDQSPTKYAAANQQYVETAYQLYQKLIAPLENQLTEQLIIVPDGVLGYLPFDVLLKEKPQKADDFRNHHYLLKYYQISYAYSATLLQEMQDKKHHPTKRLLAFAPSFNGDAIASRNIQDIRRALGNLKYNIPEAEQIHSLMGGDIYKGLEATEPLFWDIASQYQILHLSTHGKADDRVGDYSFLAFSEIPDSIENEKLYVRDLYNLQLNADMVVLSACETGIGELQRGEGILSLARGFAYAGAKSIINTLWSVNDESTQYLMKRFYTHLKAGQPKDAALRQAKLDYIQNGQQADPFFWAAFIPIGDMAPLEFSYAFPIWLLGWIIGLMGIIVILYLRSSKR